MAGSSLTSSDELTELVFRTACTYKHHPSAYQSGFCFYGFLVKPVRLFIWKIPAYFHGFNGIRRQSMSDSEPSNWRFDNGAKKAPQPRKVGGHAILCPFPGDNSSNKNIHEIPTRFHSINKSFKFFPCFVTCR